MFRRVKSRGGGLLSALAGLVVRRPLAVIGAWVVVMIALLVFVPSLSEVSARNPPDFLPKSAPILKANKEMVDAFKPKPGEGNNAAGASGSNFLAVVLVNDNGLTKQDEVTYKAVVDGLRADPESVQSVQDWVAIPEIRPAMTSRDGKAWNLPVSLVGSMGTGKGQKAFRNAEKIIAAATENSTLKPNLVGAAASFEDVQDIGIRDQHIIELSTLLVILTILILVYRNIVAMLLPIITIGISLMVAQQSVAILGSVNLLGLSPQTIMLMTGMMMGAGVDYAVFLFSRYHEYIREGLSSDDAVVAALTSIGEVIAGSAGTVAITFMGLSFATLGVFSSVGPALAVTIAVGFLASLTLLPALVVLAGRRGWVKPRKDLTGRFWRRSGINIVRRPKLNLFASLIVLISLAACATLVQFNYDDRKNLPADSFSMSAYAKMNEHFPISSSLQQFIVIRAPNTDLRSPRALADMEEMARRIAQLPDIDAIRGITRPNGETIREGRATWQAGEVGSKLGQASNYIEANDANLNMLGGGSVQMANVLNQIRVELIGAVGSVRGLAAALDELSIQYGGATRLAQLDAAASLIDSMRELGDSLGLATRQVTDVQSWASPMVNALNSSPQCNTDPNCVQSRSDLQQLLDDRNRPALTYISKLGQELAGTDEGQSLSETLRALTTNLRLITESSRELGLAETHGIERRLDATVQGANMLADSSRALAIGTQLLVESTKQMGGGLDQASAFLLAMRRDAADPPMSGFYIPPQVLTQAEFKKAAKLFISDDGHTARYLVQTALDPFGTAAMDQVDLIVKTANDAKPNTTLAGAKISMVGFTAGQNDIRDFYNSDIKFIVVTTLLVVFLILMVLLRSLVAPLYLVASVVLSYMSAIGIAVVFFQFVLGQQIFWNTPGMTFLVLVAVGADYNLLLISRIREEAHLGIRTAVVRTVGATGGVITSAGLIFAASMLALTVSSIAGIVQTGFIIGVGLLLDTFLVRTITVPAMCVLMGKANWWPSKGPQPKPRKVRKRPRPGTPENAQRAEMAPAGSGAAT
jgi:putative drug exporter of the RND superfamily